VKPVLNLVCYVSLCEGLRAGASSLSYIVHVDCCGLSTIVIKKIIIIIIIRLINTINTIDTINTINSILLVGVASLSADFTTWRDSDQSHSPVSRATRRCVVIGGLYRHVLDEPAVLRGGEGSWRGRRGEDGNAYHRSDAEGTSQEEIRRSRSSHHRLRRLQGDFFLFIVAFYRTETILETESPWEKVNEWVGCRVRLTIPSVHHSQGPQLSIYSMVNVRVRVRFKVWFRVRLRFCSWAMEMA